VSLETWADVLANVPIEVQGAMTEQDLADIVIAISRDPSSAKDLFDAAKAGAATVHESLWQKAWDVLNTAAQVAGIVTSLGGVAVML
jgi:hypothetical protein